MHFHMEEGIRVNVNYHGDKSPVRPVFNPQWEFVATVYVCHVQDEKG